MHPQNQKKTTIERIVKETTAGTTRSAKDAAELETLMREIAAITLQAQQFTRNQGSYAPLAEQTRGDIAELRAKVSFSKYYVVIDFDSFFASVEERDNPRLSHIPIVVTDATGKMIETSNYKAREWGIRAGMPVFVARALCNRGPEFGMPRVKLTTVDHHSEKYKQAAETSRSIFHIYGEGMIPKSIDEAFLDLTDYLAEKRW